QRGGNRVDRHFKNREVIVMAKDMGFQLFMSDVLHWLVRRLEGMMMMMSGMYLDSSSRSLRSLAFADGWQEIRCDSKKSGIANLRQDSV
ncbi:hypothetical protein J132_01533, partial [Termitomyces sp. J132]